MNTRATAGYLGEQALVAAIQHLFAAPERLVFGEETARQAQTRFVQAVDALCARTPQGTLVLVAHGTVLALYAQHAAGVEPFALWQRLGSPSYLVFDRHTGYLTEVVPGVES